MDLLSEDDVCGQRLLRIVSRGNSILAELSRLAANIPQVFLGRADATSERYLRVLFDFDYLKNPDNYEASINRSIDLLDIDDEFQENNMVIIERFYVLFENVWKYVTDFNKFLSDLREGFFISHSTEEVLLNPDGRQLMCEALFLYGVMLLMMDRLIPGPVREKLVVCYIRYKGESALDNVEEITKLVRNTGYVPGKQAPSKYPEKYFKRFPIDKTVVAMIIDRLRSDDVYNMIRIYPAPDHRSVALSQQAAMLYVVLYFAPDILNGRLNTMREIVDKHFNDNWIISVHMGWVVNLSQEWNRYRAAREALKNTLALQNIEELVVRHCESLDACEKKLMSYLKEGVLVEEYILDNTQKLMHSVRDCNVVCRWLLLHHLETDKKLGAMLQQRLPKRPRVLQVLLHAAQLEYKFKQIAQTLLNNKEERWEDCQTQAADRMKELAEYFSGQKQLTRVKKDTELEKWFNKLAKSILALKYSSSNHSKTGRKIQLMLEALVSVEQFEEIDTSLQIKEFLQHSRDFLMNMVRMGQITETTMSTLDQVTDFSYAWEVIDSYVPFLHALVEKNPNSVVLFRATFKKLTSILDVPLTRILQAKSADLASVSMYYSNELVAFVRRVLEVIPKNVFRILSDLIKLQSTEMTPLPTKMEVVKINLYAQLDQRYELSRCTHQISVFTEGILGMKQVLLGVIQIDPRKILEDGIRKQLVTRISQSLHRYLQFQPVDKRQGLQPKQVEDALNALAGQLDGFKTSFEYIQDYINVYGLKIWQEEFSRVMNYNVEQECNLYLKKKVNDQQSIFQSRAIPIPRFAGPPGDAAVNFTGRLANALKTLTSFHTTIYSPECLGWYHDSGAEVVGVGMFSRLNRSVGVAGLIGIDRILSFQIVRNLQNLTKYYSKQMTDNLRQQFVGIEGILNPTTEIGGRVPKCYDGLRKKTVTKHLEAICDTILEVGQCQLLRKQISNELNFSCQLDSKLLCCTLKNMNTAILKDIRAHYRNQDTMPYPKDNNPLLSELSKYLECAGLSDPLTKIYITSDPLQGLVIFLFAFLLTYLAQLRYSSVFDTVVRRDKKVLIDGAPLTYGIVTILQQFHPTYTVQLFAYLGQFVRYQVLVTYSDKKLVNQGLTPDVQNVIGFMNLFAKATGMSRTLMYDYVPAYILDRLNQ